jgi:hypothetical protein
MELFIMQVSPVSHHFALLGPNILLTTLFSNTRNLCSSLKETNTIGLSNSAEADMLAAPGWQNHRSSRTA